MVVTGRAVLLALLLTAPVAVVARSLAAVLAVNAVLLGVLVLDALLAGSPRTLVLARSGDDSLDGGAGADTMAGGTGNDVYVVGGSSDVVTESETGRTKKSPTVRMPRKTPRVLNCRLR